MISQGITEFWKAFELYFWQIGWINRPRLGFWLLIRCKGFVAGESYRSRVSEGYSVKIWDSHKFDNIKIIYIVMWSYKSESKNKYK